MMKTLKLAVIVCLLGGNAIFGNGWYADVKGGVNFLTIEPLVQTNDIEISAKTNPGSVLGASAGYAWHGWRFEGEFSHRKNTIDGFYCNDQKILDQSGSFESFSGLGNVLLTLPSGTIVSPYIGGGFGYGHTVFKANNFITDSQTGEIYLTHIDPKTSYNKFLGQFLVGTNVAVTESIGLRADYRYLKPIDTETQNHSLVACLDWNF